MEKLFEIEPKNIKEKCKDCDYFERWHCNSKVFFYCAARRSTKTSNGKLKIKANDKACGSFKSSE